MTGSTAANETQRTQRVTIDEVVTTVIMARVTDYFGFFVYAIASAIVFPTLFFPMFDPLTGMMASFAVFSLAFLARPVASIASRRFQPVIGQAAKISLALMIFGSSTAAIAFLPGYESIGWLAPALLVALRIGQGFGLGGAWDGITMQLQNAAPDHRKGLYGMVPQLGGPIGFCVAGSLFFVLTGFLTDEEFMKFGWRFAFFGVIAVNVVSLFARLRLLTADFGTERISTESAPLPELLRHQWRPILISAMMPLASYALLHMVTVFPLAYTVLYGTHDVSTILLYQLAGGSLAVVSVIASGVLSDKYGRARILGICTALFPPLCLTLPTLQDYPAVYIISGFILLGLAHGQSSAIAPARFAPKYRYSGAAMSTNLSWIVGAAFAPLVGIALTATLGLWASGMYLMSGALVTAFVLYARYGRRST